MASISRPRRINAVGGSGRNSSPRRRCGLRLLLLDGIFLLSTSQGFGSAITLSLHATPGGVPVSGGGTNFATLDFGTVSPFGVLPAAITRTLTASSYTVSTAVGVQLVRSSGTSPNYTLQCRQMAGAPLTWKMNGVALSTNFATVAAVQPYNTMVAHDVALVIPFGSAGGAVSTTLEVLAIAN